MFHNNRNLVSQLKTRASGI